MCFDESFNVRFLKNLCVPLPIQINRPFLKHCQNGTSLPLHVLMQSISLAKYIQMLSNGPLPGGKKQGAKNRVWNLFCYPKREEARLSLLFLNNKEKVQTQFFASHILDPYIFKVQDPKKI